MVTQNPAIAEEILQDALTQLWATPTTPAEESEFRRYLYRVIVSRATDYHRRQALARRIRFWQRAPSQDPMVEIDRRAGDVEMGHLLRALSPRERQVAYLYYFEDRSAEDVANHLGVKPATVRVLLHRLIAKLRRLAPALDFQEQSS
jgi:RNA polymerase sigma-70 factor (ECF subfamily)